MNTTKDSKKAQWEKERVKNWEMIWDGHYRNKDGTLDPEFNFAGWLDSYTGNPIPTEYAREWVQSSVERIQNLLPADPDLRKKARILEIGCGTGLLVYRLAPLVAEYVGIDPSESAVNGLRQHLERKGVNHVHLHKRTALEITDFEKQSFDLIILNSVAQYFPSAEYMLEVLKEALPLLKPAGHMFLGDIRNYALFDAFHASVCLAKSTDDMLIEKFKLRYERRKLKEPEILYDPGFFLSLREIFPSVDSVQVELLRGNYLFEMTMFRYDATIRMNGENVQERTRIEWRDWRTEKFSIDKIDESLRSQNPTTLAVRDIQNSRVQAHASLVRAFRSHATNAGELRSLALAAAQAEPGQNPEEFWALGQKHNYKTIVGWPTNSMDGAFSVLFTKQEWTQSFPIDSFEVQPLEKFSNRF